MGQIVASMAPSADEAYVHEHCKVLSVLPIVLDTPGHSCHTCGRALESMGTCMSQCVLPCAGAGVEEEHENEGEDEAMAEAEQVQQLREAGEEY